MVTAGATPPATADEVGECCAEVVVEIEVAEASESPLSRGSCCALRALLRSAASHSRSRSHSYTRSFSCAVQCECAGECAGAGRSTLIKCVSESLDREAHADADADAGRDGDGDEDCGGQGTPAAVADPLLAGADAHAEAEAVAASTTMLADLLSAVS